MPRRVPEGPIVNKSAGQRCLKKGTICRNCYTGQPWRNGCRLSIHLFGCLHGITGERRLAEDLHLNPASRRFVGYDINERTPDHSVLSRSGGALVR